MKKFSSSLLQQHKQNFFLYHNFTNKYQTETNTSTTKLKFLEFSSKIFPTQKLLFQIGNSYLKGIGVQKDLKKGFEYLKQSCEKGNLESMKIVADCYFNGIGVSKDLKEAFNLFLKLSDKGNIKASSIIGKYYYYGWNDEINF